MVFITILVARDSNHDITTFDHQVAVQPNIQDRVNEIYFSCNMCPPLSKVTSK